jgi:hypothetical protein
MFGFAVSLGMPTASVGMAPGLDTHAKHFTIPSRGVKVPEPCKGGGFWLLRF